MILRWNGRKWAQVASPHPGTNGELHSVAATSASNAWAVGQFDTGSNGTDQNFAIHCC